MVGSIEFDSGEFGVWCSTTQHCTPGSQQALVRLAGKKIPRSRLGANTRPYTALITREQAQKSALKLLLDRSYQGDLGLLVQALLGGAYLKPAEKKALVEGFSKASNQN